MAFNRRRQTNRHHHHITQTESCFPLSRAACNQCVQLVSIEGGHSMRRRLTELGLNPGCKVRVIQSYGGGPLILGIKNDARMAIGRGMAQKILVRLTPDTDTTEGIV